MKQLLHIMIQIGFLFLFYAVGMFIQKITHIPIPGSILGMIILFLVLLTKKVPSKWLETGANTLLSHLQLFFVPVTVGIIEYLSYFFGKGVISLVVVLLSTAIVLVTTGWSTQYILTKKEEDLSA
ncbi:CidA/LrgA family protein [Bacillus sp. RD4P76]|uniref:CidA/LrgA family protein n=1 Tax=Bacillus suaedaesalsae TaxID=2810349 RepID=A0ABS2DD55_9BACI|nr:CidA/LrgA family protein [Bacillus suaedaesalsae]